MVRPNWDETWLPMARIIAQRSRCARRGIGAIVVSRDNAYSVVGYNGPPAGMQLPEDSNCIAWCPRIQVGGYSARYDNCITAHAEANALTRADFSRIQGGTLYVSSACCWDCGKLVANSGVARVVMQVDEVQDAHRDPHRTIKMLEQCGVTVTIWGESEDAALLRRGMYEVQDG